MDREKYKIGDRVEFFVNRAFYVKRKQGTILKIKGILFKKYLIEMNVNGNFKNTHFGTTECIWVKNKNIYKKVKDNSDMTSDK